MHRVLNGIVCRYEGKKKEKLQTNEIAGFGGLDFFS
jgi:hypothetical protein